MLLENLGLIPIIYVKEGEGECGEKIAIAVFGRWKQVNPCGSLASKGSLLGEFQDNDRPCLKKVKI